MLSMTSDFFCGTGVETTLTNKEIARYRLIPINYILSD